MAGRLRILVAEDDRDMLELTRTILGQTDEVDIADHPAPALRLIAAREYDLLITDLNICHACDGLLLAGAMRALHPRARTVLVTGNPDFTRALHAMQSSLDLIVLKPVEIDLLRGIPRMAPVPPGGAAPRYPGKATVAEVLAAHRAEIIAAWMKLVRADPVLGALPLDDAERLDHVAHLLDALAGIQPDPEDERAAAEEHGRTRRGQNYRVAWVAAEVSYLRRAAVEMVINNLLELDLGQLPFGLFDLHTRLDTDLLHALLAFGLVSG